MPKVSRSRTVPAAPERVWEVIADPYDMPRWWPLVARMEAVDEDQFTQVLTTRKGKLVRADFRIVVSHPPAGGHEAGRRVWEQEVEGTPFERVLGQAITEVVVEPVAGGTTRVTITLTQQLRGYSRTGGFLLRRATRTKLSEALAALEALF